MARKWQFSLLVLMVLFLHDLLARAGWQEWAPVTETEKTLKTNTLDPGAGSVVLFKHGDILVQAANLNFWSTHIITYTRIKILSDAGRDAANVVLESPSYLRLSKVEGRAIRPSGEIVPLDTSKLFHGTVYSEGKSFSVLSTSFTFPSAEPGTIIEYQTEEYVDWFYAPPWIFDTRGIATLESTLTTEISADLAMAQLPLETTVNKVAVAQKRTNRGLETDFTVHNIPPIREEPYSMPFRDRAVMVIFNPRELLIVGQLVPLTKDWDDVGQSISREANNLNMSNKETIAKAKDLIQGVSDPHARAMAIYKYLQKNVVSNNLAGVYFGNSADAILSSKKGNPSEINAIFVTMLKEAKVDAELVGLSTRNWQTFMKEFPASWQVTRAIVRVHFKDNPIFADAASTGASFGQLPWFESDVVALDMKGGKGQIVQIPPAAPSDNLSTSRFTFRVAPDWKIEGDVELELRGTGATSMRTNFADEKPERVQTSFSRYFGFNGPDDTVSSLTRPDFQDSAQPLVVKAHLERAPESSEGGDFVLNPWMADPGRTPAFKSTQRQSFLMFEAPRTDTTTSVWNLPTGVEVEKLPGEVKLQSDMADYSHSCTQTGSVVTCTRTFTLKKTLDMDPKRYAPAKTFFDEVGKHDQELLLLHKR